jgi:hypothetical protein
METVLFGLGGFALMGGLALWRRYSPPAALMIGFLSGVAVMLAWALHQMINR